MRCTYRLRVDKISNGEGHFFTVYGIDAFDADRLIMSVPDVFCDKRKTQDLIARCNEFELEPVHLMDVISDELDSAAF